MKKILIFGGGQIGTFYLNYFTDRGIKAQVARDKDKETDIRDAAAVAAAIDRFKPTVVINTAAMTNLEWCGQNRLDTCDVNVLGAANLAKVCDEKKLYMVH